MNAGQQIAAAFAAIQAEGEEERKMQRRRELMAELQKIPSGTPVTPEHAALWAEYESLLP